MTDYAELHAHSEYSFLDGVSSPEALVERAAALHMPALALTDHDAVYGAVFFRRRPSHMASSRCSGPNSPSTIII